MQRGIVLAFLFLLFATCATSFKPHFCTTAVHSKRKTWTKFQLSSDSVTDNDTTTFLDPVATTSSDIPKANVRNGVWRSSKASDNLPFSGSGTSPSGKPEMKYSPSSPWKPGNKSAGINNNNNGTAANRSNGAVSHAVEMKRPMLYIKYRAPRVMTDSKKMLLAQQETFRRIFEATVGARYSGSGNNGRSDSAGGSSSGSGPPRGRSGGATFDPSSVPLISRTTDTTRRRPATSGGNSYAKKKPNDNSNSIEQRRRASGGTSSNNNRNRRANGNEIELDEEGNRIEFDDMDDYGDEGDFESSDVDEVTLLEDIDSSELLQMLSDELSVEEIMEILSSQYGVRTNFKELKKRLSEVKDDTFRSRRTGKTRRDRKKKIIAKYTPDDVNANVIKLPAESNLSIKQLAELMDLGTGEILKYLMVNEGVLININQSITRELAVKVLTAFGKTVQEEDELVTLAKEVEAMEKAENNQKKDHADGHETQTAVLVPRPPVVTIMGHVDHGKTSLLDKIRNAQVALSEAGGITQAISAFKVNLSPSTFDDYDRDLLDEDNEEISVNKPREITFIDTPGHAAFSEMRTRGAKMTDIVVLVIAADDGIMEQTRECIQAAKLAQCPLVIAINKVDKVGANVEKVKQDLLNEGLLLEEYGGDIQMAMVSAKTGDGIDELLEKISLQAEVMPNLKARITGGVEGTVVEGSVDKGLGVVVTALIQQGTVKVGQTLVCGTSFGKVRLLLNDQGQSVNEAGPSTPVRIIGMNRVPSAGDSIVQADNDNLAKEMSEARLRYMKDQQLSLTSSALRGISTAGLLGGTFDSREIIKLPIVLKADVGGSLEALLTALSGIVVEDESAICRLDVVYSGIGDVTTSDISLAASAKAKVLAFNTAATMSAQDDARAKNVLVQYYTVLYDVLDEMRALVEATITPPAPGTVLGKAVIKKLFTIGRTGKVAGCLVESGRIVKNAQVRVLRGKTPVFVGILSTLKIVKEDQMEVLEGQECGMALKGFEDFEEGDFIECFQVLQDGEEDNNSNDSSNNNNNNSGSSGKSSSKKARDFLKN